MQIKEKATVFTVASQTAHQVPYPDSKYPYLLCNFPVGSFFFLLLSLHTFCYRSSRHLISSVAILTTVSVDGLATHLFVVIIDVKLTILVTLITFQ